MTDFVELEGLCPPAQPGRRGQRSATVAAASIVAKVTRDRIMAEADRLYPEYGFGRHKGYATEEHRLARGITAPAPCTAEVQRGVGAGICS